MGVTRFAAIFDVNAEEASAGFAAAVRTSPITDTGEGNLIGRRLARKRSRAAVTTNPIHNRLLAVLAGQRIHCGIQACAIECVEEGSVEVAFQTALDVANV